MDIKHLIKKYFKTDPETLNNEPISTTPYPPQIHHTEKSASPLNTSTANESSGDMTQDLMRLIGSAIEQWSNMYHLENLPKKIVFQQALSAMNAMNKILESTDKEV